jgi:hypothetical protein
MKINVLFLFWSLLGVDSVFSFQSLRDFKNSKVFINNGKNEIESLNSHDFVDDL